MKYEEFLELNRHYRLVCEWSSDLQECNKEAVFIPCYGNKGTVSWKDNDNLQLHMFVSPNTQLDKLKQKYGLTFECHGENGEYLVIFNAKYLDIIDDFFKLKRQAMNRVPITSIRNITTFLRVLSNVHPRYKTILEKYIDERKSDTLENPQ